MDVEAFVSVHQPQWDRLAQLTRRQRRLTGAEADELVSLYQRVGTHLAALRASRCRPGNHRPAVRADCRRQRRSDGRAGSCLA